MLRSFLRSDDGDFRDGETKDTNDLRKEFSLSTLRLQPLNPPLCHSARSSHIYQMTTITHCWVEVEKNNYIELKCEYYLEHLQRLQLSQL